MSDGVLSGKRALLTGATRGIGRAVARAYAAHGAELLLSGRDVARLDAVAAECTLGGARPSTLPADLASGAGASDLAAAALERCDGRLDVLVHCAGNLAQPAPLTQLPESEWEATLAVHVGAAFRLVRGLWPALSAAPAASVVLVGSGAGRRGIADLGAYCAAKFALEGFHQSLARELEGGSVRVNLVSPGRVDTDMQALAYDTLGPAELADPEELAPLFVHLASDASRALHGARLDGRGRAT